MISFELTPKIALWLGTPPEKRDLQEGATLLLQVTRNRILFDNIMRRLPDSGDIIEYHLKKIHMLRLEAQTHQQVAGLMKQVNVIAQSHGLNRPEPAAQQATAQRTELQRGKRADHDELPPAVQQLYVDNADLARRMRECHTRLRMITQENSTCPDSDRLPFALELIKLDKKYRENFNLYDHYVKGTDPEDTVLAVDARTAARNAAKTCNLLLGKYAKKEDPQLAARIRAAYAKVVSPSEALTAKMQAASLL